MQNKTHWENAYRNNAANQVSWFQEKADLSVQLLTRYCHVAEASVIDVGGGASTFVDGLLELGLPMPMVLDLSDTALNAAQQRLGSRAGLVRWLDADILSAELPSLSFDVWHDRAVFHFLNSPQERQKYVGQLAHALKPGGLLIIATFSLRGPEKCSGLPVSRYDAESLQQEFGSHFELLCSEFENHNTPSGKQQSFIYCCFRKI